jgi:hypothetical protein
MYDIFVDIQVITNIIKTFNPVQALEQALLGLSEQEQVQLKNLRQFRLEEENNV